MGRRACLILILALVLPAAAWGTDPSRAVRGATGSRGAEPGGTASIEGEVARPGVYPIREGDTLSSLILAAGGTTDKAWLPGAVLVRPSEKARQAEELNAIARRLAAAIRSAGPGDAGSDAMRRFLDALSTLAPSGRIPIRLLHPRLLINAPEDLPIRDGDILRIPAAPRTVRVLGAVRRPGEVEAPAGVRPAGLAASAGGFLPDADRDGAILLSADGTARLLSEGWVVWNEAAGRWELSRFRRNRPRIEPGDTVFIPRDPGRIPWPGGIEDYRKTMARILEITGAGADW